ncbi:hypothetical protein ACJQWK_10389 [Exserohilum turcicum]
MKSSKADQQKLPRRDSLRKLVTVPYRVVQCRRDYQMSPKLELGHRKKETPLPGVCEMSRRILFHHVGLKTGHLFRAPLAFPVPQAPFLAHAHHHGSCYKKLFPTPILAARHRPQNLQG